MAVPSSPLPGRMTGPAGAPHLGCGIVFDGSTPKRVVFTVNNRVIATCEPPVTRAPLYPHIGLCTGEQVIVDFDAPAPADFTKAPEPGTKPRPWDCCARPAPHKAHNVDEWSLFLGDFCFTVSVRSQTLLSVDPGGVLRHPGSSSVGTVLFATAYSKEHPYFQMYSLCPPTQH